MMEFMRSLSLLALLAAVSFCQDGSDPWPKTDLLEPAALAQAIQSSNPPVVLAVPFAVLYRSKHILHAIDGGTGSKPEGIETLKRAVASLSKDADIVVYCGCCPMVKCPNIRPAYRTLKEMGFTHVRVLNIPTNMHTDWYTKDYPSEAGSAATPASSSQK
jgi:thiosulfate/3-mercaptopyruvate sulfurtransferase